MIMRPWVSSVRKKTPLWIKGTVFALCLNTLLVGMGIFTVNAMLFLQIDCLHSSGRLCSLYPTISLLAMAAMGPGLFFLDPVSQPSQAALALVLPAAICSLVGASCFISLGVKRGAILTAALILLIDIGSFLIFFLPNIG